ncbi:MAG: hypothetical protein ACLR78_13955 [Roseburia sp.]
MELKELTEKVTGLLDVQNTEELPEKIFETVKNDDFNVYEKFCDIVQDLSVDWLQMIFQYYHADRKRKDAGLYSEKPCIVYWKIGRKSRSSNRSVRG